MAIYSGFTRDRLPSPIEVMQVNASPKANAVVNAAIQQSVQEFPPAINSGAFFGQVVRGPILPPYGTKDRDYMLRLMYRNEYNNLAQAIVSGLTKKLITVPWAIDGDKGNLLYIQDAFGRTRSIEAVDHYTNVLNNAQFGAGWGPFLSMWLEDFFTQDFGGIMELIGPGEPTGPIQGPVMGIAHLDAGRSYITGNPYYPIMYFSLISGSLHRMHADRIIRLVDSPSPDERYFMIGLCALSRTIAVQNRQQLMNRYIEGLVDDKPKPGILSISNMTQPQWEKLVQAYLRTNQSDQPGTFGKTLVLMGMDVEKEIKVSHMPFSDTPEKFDWTKYTELDVHALAAGFNIDVQEIWELTGRGGAGGNSGQSQVLHQKSEAKMQGFLLQTMERDLNGQMLNRSDVTLQFKYNDPVQQENDATIDGQLATTFVNMVNTGKVSDDEARAYLKNNSERFARALTDDLGDLEGGDSADGVDIQQNDPIDHTVPPAQPQPTPGTPALVPTEQPTIPRAQPKTPAPMAAKPTPQPVHATGIAPSAKPVPKQPVVARRPNPRKARGRVGHSGGVAQKSLETDAQRKWFFANYPQFGGDISHKSHPGFAQSDTAETKQKKLAQWAESSKHPITNHLWDSGMINYNEKAEIAIQPQATKEAAQKLVSDVRDAQLPRDYLTKLYGEQRGISGSQAQIENKFNAEMSQRAKAIRFAADHGQVKLTDAQNRYIDAFADGKYLDTKYGQYASADNGTLLGPKEGGAVTRGGRSDYAQYMHDVHREEFINMRFGKSFTHTASDFERRFTKALVKGVDGKLDRDAFEQALLDMLADGAVKAYADGLRTGGHDGALDSGHQSQLYDFLTDQIDYIDGLGQSLADGQLQPTGEPRREKAFGDVIDAIRRKAEMWVRKSLKDVYYKGLRASNGNPLMQWNLGATEQHCPDCYSFDGVTKPFNEWYDSGFLPQSKNLACGGWNCDCSLNRVEEKSLEMAYAS